VSGVGAGAVWYDQDNALSSAALDAWCRVSVFAAHRFAAPLALGVGALSGRPHCLALPVIRYGQEMVVVV
jgi:hypothetical protein